MLATWTNANRIQKYGGCGFEATDLNMVFMYFYSVFTVLLPSIMINLYSGGVFLVNKCL